MEETEGSQGYSIEGGKGEACKLTPTDLELMGRIQEGDEQAIASLYGRYSRKILNYIYRFTGDRYRAQDLMQETFIRVIQNAGSYRPIGSVGGWIYRIAKNLTLNTIRDERLGKTTSLDEPVIAGEESMSRKDNVVSAELGPDEKATQHDAEQVIQRALKKLSPAYREVLILCDIEGYAYNEAAEILQCPINTVASRLARGRSQMARILGFLRKERGK